MRLRGKDLRRKRSHGWAAPARALECSAPGCRARWSRPAGSAGGGSPGERKRRPVPASGTQQHRLPSGYLADAQGGDKCLGGVQVVFDLRQSQLSTVGDQVPDRSHCSALKDWWFYPARYGVRPVTAGQPTPIRLRRYNPRRVTCWVSAKAARAVTVARAAVSIKNRGVGIFSSEGGGRPVGGDKCGKREGGARLEQGIVLLLLGRQSRG